MPTVRPRGVLLAATVFAVLSLGAAVARAEDEPTVPVDVDVPTPFELRGTGGTSGMRASCAPPCRLRLVPGTYRFVSSKASGDEVAFTGPSRLTLNGPAEPLHTTGLVLAGVGVLAVAAPIVAIFSTCSSNQPDVNGRVETRRCVDFGAGTDKALAIVAGGGFALAVTGAILFFATAGGLKVDDIEPKRTGFSLSKGAFVF
jgi:hypothetical protein